MTNLEILESAIDFTNERYFKEYSKSTDEPIRLSMIQRDAIQYSGQVLHG